MDPRVGLGWGIIDRVSGLLDTALTFLIIDLDMLRVKQSPQE